MKKNNEEKNNEQINSDIHGRIEYIDQSLRSVDNRMRAVEKRLSLKISEADYARILPEKGNIVDESCQNDMNEKLQGMDQRLMHLEKATQETKEIYVKEVESLNSHLLLIENRISKLENLNKITIGKIKVPIEFSGIAATIIMFVTGYLIYTDHWNIIRSTYYPVAIGVVFGAVVIGKFIITNRE